MLMLVIDGGSSEMNGVWREFLRSAHAKGLMHSCDS